MNKNSKKSRLVKDQRERRRRLNRIKSNKAGFRASQREEVTYTLRGGQENKAVKALRPKRNQCDGD